MKDSIYFSHDADARNDEKIIGLIMEHGMEGYGIFWSIVEMLRTATDYKMHLDYKRIAFALHVDDEKVESIIHGFDLFDSDAQFFWSASLLRRMNLKNLISDERRKAAKLRWDKAKAMQLHSKSNANEMQKQCNKGKKVKKESKEKKYSDDAYRVAEYLLSQIKTHKPDIKDPNLETWAEDIDKAIRIDGRDPRRLCEVAKWAHVVDIEEFWRPNLLSGKKLRVQFDKIEIKMKKSDRKPAERVNRLPPLTEKDKLKPIWEDQ